MSRPHPEYHYIAYIDEAGDPGLSRVKPRSMPGSSEWLVVAGAVVQAERERQVGIWIQDLMSAIGSRQLRDIHFQKLDHYKKSVACAFLAGRAARLFVVISNKQNMQAHKNPFAGQIPSDNWFYCWMTRVLLERMSNYVLHKSIQRYGEPKYVKLEFSERGGLRYSQMHAYFEWLRMKSSGGKLPLYLPMGKVHFEVLHQDLMRVYNHLERDGLKLPDIAASAFFKASDIYDTRQCDPTYAQILRPRMARAPMSEEIAGYGVKLLPNWRTLDRFGVREEQKHIFRFYGYPGRSWWQPRAVDPGLV